MDSEYEQETKARQSVRMYRGKEGQHKGVEQIVAKQSDERLRGGM